MNLEDFKNYFDEKMRNITDTELVEEFKVLGYDMKIIPMKLKTIEDIPQDWKRLTVRKKTNRS